MSSAVWSAAQKPMRSSSSRRDSHQSATYPRRSVVGLGVATLRRRETVEVAQQLIAERLGVLLAREPTSVPVDNMRAAPAHRFLLGGPSRPDR